MSDMVFSSLREVAVAVHAEKTPSDDEWSDWIALCEQVRAQSGKVRVLVSTRGSGGPNARQRQLLVDFGKRNDLRLSILTTSKIARGIATALRWVGLPIRAFEPEQLLLALDFLSVDRELAPQLRDMITQLHRRL